MKINKIITSLKNKRMVSSIEKRERELAKYVNVHNKTTYGTSYEQIMEARSTLANYAKHNNISIDIYDARKTLDADEFVPPMLENSLSDKLLLKITNLKNKKSNERIIDANTDKQYLFQIKDLALIKEGNVADAHFNYSDNFIRHFYRQVEKLAKTVTGKK